MKQLRNMGINPSGPKLFYQIKIKSILAHVAPVWHSFLSKNNRIKLGRIQKLAIYIMRITGDLNYKLRTRLVLTIS